MLTAKRIDSLLNGRAVIEGRDERMQEWHGLTPWDGPACPRVVAGKRCGYGDCLCKYGGGATPLLDHKGLWRDRRRRKVFTAEPYSTSLDLDLLEGFRSEVQQLGLRLRLSAASPWFPTRTILILVEPDDVEG